MAFVEAFQEFEYHLEASSSAFTTAVAPIEEALRYTEYRDEEDEEGPFALESHSLSHVIPEYQIPPPPPPTMPAHTSQSL